MSKHKKDKHAKSIREGLPSQQPGVPPTAGEQPANTGDGDAFQHQDPSRRLGDFEGTGEHARTGNRGHQ